MTYKVALCGLTLRDERLIEIVVSRAPNPKYHYDVGTLAKLGTAHIAIADAASSHAEPMVAELRALNPALVVVYISDLGMTGDSRYRIERRSLLLRINRVLDEAVEHELLHAETPAPQSLIQRLMQTRQTSTAPVPAMIEAGSDNAFSNDSAPLEAAPPPPLRALIVDDSLTVREQLRAALQRAGILSDQAENAESAMAQLAGNTYDIVFMDVVMPGADGYEVCRTIKKNAYTRSTPVLMLTSRSSPFDRARGALAGCDSYLVKPITWETFFTAVDKILNKNARNDRALLQARGYRSAMSH